MGMLVRLPLTNDLQNIGTDGSYTAHSSTASFTGDGILGNCITGGTTNWYLYNDTYPMDFTIMFWYYAADQANMDIYIKIPIRNIGLDAVTELSFIKMDYTSTTGDKAIKVATNGNNPQCFWLRDSNTSVSDSIPKWDYGTWNHFAVTWHSEGGTLTAKCFVNGADANYTYTGQYGLELAPGEFYVTLGSGCRMNDLRIYDNIVSEEDIYEISKGLCTHFPLNSPICVSVNLLNGQLTSGTFTKSASNIWYDGVYCPTTYITPGRSYQWSMLVRATTEPTSGDILPKIDTNCSCTEPYTGNDAAMTYIKTFLPSKITTEWQQVSACVTVYADAVDPYIHHSFCPYQADNLMVDTITFEYKNMELIEIEDPTVVIGTREISQSYVADVSGCGYPAWSEPKVGALYTEVASPVYDRCTRFDSNHYLTFENPWYIPGGSTAVASQLTVAFWVNCIDIVSYPLIFAPYSAPTSGGPWIAVSMTENNAIWAYIGGASAPYNKPGSIVSGGINAGTWYHIAFVYDHGTSTFYCNGIKASSSATHGTTTITWNQKLLSIGDSYTGDSWGGTAFNGYLSDFRLYGTVLTDSDIEKLYNQRHQYSIVEDGTIHSMDLLEGDSISLGTNGVIESFGFTESTSGTNLIIADSMRFQPTAISNWTSNVGHIIPTDLTVGQYYTIEFDLAWNGFDTSNEEGTFNLYIQGFYQTQEEDGTITNNWKQEFLSESVRTALPNSTSNANSLYSLVVNNPKGSKHISANTIQFTETHASRYRIYFGVRSDYSNGTGWLEIRNLKMYPRVSVLQEESLRLTSDSMITKEFIET